MTAISKIAYSKLDELLSIIVNDWAAAKTGSN
jgi:hypothetical protein